MKVTSISDNINDLQGNPSALVELHNIQSKNALNDDNYDFLKSEIVSFRNLEMSLWYELISDVSNEDKVKNIFHRSTKLVLRR